MTLLSVALLAFACGGRRPPRAPEPSPLDLSGVRPPPVVQRLRVLALVDESYRRIPDFDVRITDRLAAVSDHMAALFGLPVDLARFVPWSAPDAARDAEEMLGALEAAPADELTPDADLIIAFTAAPLPPRPRLDHLVRSRYAGRVVVVRSLATLFPPGQRDRLHRAEVLALLRGLGTVFGALPACGETVMADRPPLRLGDPDAARSGWDDLNLALIRAHATLDLRAGAAGSRVPADLARRVLAILPPPSAETACAATRAAAAERRALLEAVAGPPARPASSPESVAEGISALEAGDPASAFALCEPVAARRPMSPAARCAGLAAERLGRTPEALRYLRAYRAHHPDDRDVLLALARLVGRSGDDAGARALLQRWVDAHPDDVRARINLGIAHARLGDYDAARRAWQAVLDRDPENTDARDLLDRLPPP